MRLLPVFVASVVLGGRAVRPKAASGTGPAKDTATENSEPPTDEEASQRMRSATTAGVCCGAKREESSSSGEHALSSLAKYYAGSASLKLSTSRSR